MYYAYANRYDIYIVFGLNDRTADNSGIIAAINLDKIRNWSKRNILTIYYRRHKTGW